MQCVCIRLLGISCRCGSEPHARMLAAQQNSLSSSSLPKEFPSHARALPSTWRKSSRQSYARALSAAFEYDRRGSRSTLGALHPVDADRGSVSHHEERTRDPPHLSSTRTSSRGPHPGGVSGLLLDRHPEESLAGSGPGPDTKSCAGEARRHPDARCLAAHHRRPLAGDATLYAAGNRTGHPAAQTAVSPASAAAPAHQASTPISIERSSPVCGADFLIAPAENTQINLVFPSLLRNFG